jgi:superfamily II DNA or RNA helicase
VDNIYVKKKNDSVLHVGTDMGISNELSDFFSFFVPGYKFMPAYKNRVWDGKVRLFNAQSCELPVGLFPYLQEFAGPRQYTVEVDHDAFYGIPGSTIDVDIDEFVKFVEELNLSSRGKKIKPRDYQLEAVLEGIHRKRAILLSPTGSGKSLIIYLLMRYLLERTQKKVLIIVPTTSLVQQMYADFEDYSAYDDSWNPETECHRIYSGKPKMNMSQRVFISTWQSVYKLPGAWFEQFGTVFGDEVHGFKSKSLTGIMNKSREATYRFGTTGTLDGTQTHKLVLEGLFGKIYNVTTTKKLQDDETLAALDIKVMLLKYPDEVRKAFGKKQYHDEIDYIVTNDARNNLIKNLAIDQEGNTLVLFQLVDKHGKVLFDLIRNAAHERRKVFFVSGETETSDREAIRKIVEKQKNSIIVASLGTFSTGINIRNLHNIVFASPSKSQIKVLQSIGRGLRQSDDGRTTTLYDIADDLHWKARKNYTLVHSAERIKIYAKESFNYKIYEIELKT